MTTTRPLTRTERQHAHEACRTCSACTEKLTSLLDQWERQSRTIADLQGRLANAHYTKENVGRRGPAA